MAINLRREQSDFQVTEVDPISKASQGYQFHFETIDPLLTLSQQMVR